jgi:hypothetical protein
VTLRKGEPWGSPARGPVAAEVAGGDAALARCVTPGGEPPLVRYLPAADGDLARALGLAGRPAGELEVALDAMVLSALPEPAQPVSEQPVSETVAVNVVVLGTAPDRTRAWTPAGVVDVACDDRQVWAGPATAVVVANGQFLRGRDLVPRGHPGDGRLEVQVYAVGRRERAALRSRLATGTHLPHPAILERRGRTVEIRASRCRPLEADGRPLAPADRVRIRVLPGAVRVLL